MWKSPIRALSSTTAKSQEMNSSKPPATAKPSTTAIVGLDRLNARSDVRAEIWAIFTDWLVVPRNLESSMFRSAPAQNVFPRPRMITARTSSSSSARSRYSPRPISSSQLTQFFTSGRLNQIVATGPSTSYWMTCVASSTDMNTLQIVCRTEFKSYTAAVGWQEPLRPNWTPVAALVILELESGSCP